MSEEKNVSDTNQTAGAASQPAQPAAKTLDVANTSSGLDENIAAAISYISIIGLVFLFTEKKSVFVRFHAIQSILLAIGVGIISLIPFLGWLIAFFSIFIFLYGGYQAYMNEKFKFPIVGDIAEKQASNIPA